MKYLIRKLIDLYIMPLNWNAALGLFTKGRIMPGNEHLLATVHMINKQSKDKDKFAGLVIIDVGAYNGTTCIFFSKHFPNSKIMGFEPIPALFKKAREKTSFSSNISILPFALGNDAGEKDFFVSDNKVSSSLNPIHNNNSFQFERKIKVEVKLLDACLDNSNKEVLLMKLDAQGGELNILKGAKKTLKRTRFILTEMSNHTLYENGCRYYEVDEFLRANNFKLVNITSGYNYAGVTEYDALYLNTCPQESELH